MYWLMAVSSSESNSLSVAITLSLPFIARPPISFISRNRLVWEISHKRLSQCLADSLLDLAGCFGKRLGYRGANRLAHPYLAGLNANQLYAARHVLWGKLPAQGQRLRHPPTVSRCTACVGG